MTARASIEVRAAHFAELRFTPRSRRPADGPVRRLAERLSSRLSVRRSRSRGPVSRGCPNRRTTRPASASRRIRPSRSSHCANSTRSKRQSPKAALRIRHPAKRTVRSLEKAKLANSPLQRSNSRWFRVVSARPVPVSLQSANSTRWKLHPCRSAFEKSQLRKRTSENCECPSTLPAKL